MKAALAMMLLCSIVAGCGDSATSTSDSGESPAASAKAQQTVEITVTSPEDSSAVRTARIAVRGTVVPPDARVLINGEPADVTDGLFSAKVSLSRGSNDIDVAASAPGASPTSTTITVTRSRSTAEIAAARKRRRARAAARRAAATPDSTEASGGRGNCITVPNVVGKDHQLAQDTMQAAGLYLLLEEDATGQGRLLILDRNWTTVRQDPRPGSCVSEDTEVTLYAKKDGE